MTSAEQDWPRVQALVRQVWGFESLRPAQEKIIRYLLAGEDVIAILPTGGGKSLCFQIPALLRQGLTLVVSPLLALMENQVQQLHHHGLPAALLHHELSRSQRNSTLQSLARQELRLLYLSPETLLSQPVWEVLCQPTLKINGLMIDEAHCLVQWGDSFRPSYRRLGAVRSALLRGKKKTDRFAIAAFTATADPVTQKILSEVLALEQPQTVCLSPYRSNLSLTVKIAWSPRCRYHLLLGWLRQRFGQSSLIYLRSRREGEALAEQLKKEGLASQVYHAGLNGKLRRKIEQQWLNDEIPALVCTSAFGMGIDKPDVRFIVHYHPPFLLSEYLQEIGRAGRDGAPAEAVALMSEPSGWLDSQDRDRLRFFEQKLIQTHQSTLQLLNHLPSQGHINEINQIKEIKEMKGDRQSEIALALLHRLEQLEWSDPFHFQLKSGASVSAQRLRALQKAGSS
jgi:ATP-dependent DNA helicase RecQ